MSHFYSSIQGSKGEATRCGTKNSGVRGVVKGWNEGVYVEAIHHDLTDEDIFEIWINGGSNHTHEPIKIAEIKNGKIITLTGISIPIKNAKKFIEKIQPEIIMLKLTGED